VSDAESPLQRFAHDHGLVVRPDEGHGDEWPEFGPSPAVARVGLQVLVHAPYTVSMPRLFGAFVYARGGRVALELDHAHRPVVALFEFGCPVPWSEADGPERVRRMQPFRSAVEAALPELLESKGPEASAPSSPAWQCEMTWGSMSLGVVFPDLVAGVSAVRQMADAHGVSVQVHLQEALGDADPLAAMRYTG
jgi:hypothetical protein